MTTQVTIKESGYFPVSLPHNHDNGLGFMQGSVAGVYNQFPRGGFHRPHHPEVDRGLRRRFNLRGYRGSVQYSTKCNTYRCHYDPEPYFDEYTLKDSPGMYGYLENNMRYTEKVSTPEKIDNEALAPLKNESDELSVSQNEMGIPHSVNSMINSQFNNVFFLIIAIIVVFFMFGNSKF